MWLASCCPIFRIPLNLLPGTWPSLVDHGVLIDMITHVRKFFSGVFEHDGTLEAAYWWKKKSKNKAKESQQLTQKSKEKGNKIFIITLALNSYSVL